jgi:hypothetical protein
VHVYAVHVLTCSTHTECTYDCKHCKRSPVQEAAHQVDVRNTQVQLNSLTTTTTDSSVAAYTMHAMPPCRSPMRVAPMLRTATLAGHPLAEVDMHAVRMQAQDMQELSLLQLMHLLQTRQGYAGCRYKQS